MKIHFLSVFFPFRGGIAQGNANLFNAIKKLGHDVEATTFTTQYPSMLFPGKSQLVDSDDTSTKIAAKRRLNTINPWSYFKTSRFIRNEEPTILITRYWMTFFAPSLGWVCKKMGKNTKCISILDNVIPHEKRFFDNWANKFFLKHNDGFVVMSDSVKDDLLSFRPDAKFIRINHPVFSHFGKAIDQNEAKTSLKLDFDKKTILFFGFIREYKGLDLLIEAMNLLDDSYQLVIAGEVYGNFDSYQKLIDQSSAKIRIHIHTDYISDQEVPTYFSASDVCVLPYKSATQSGVTAIAQHFEIPVIATDVGGLKEVILHELTGLIVVRPEPELLADAIKIYFEKEFKKPMQKQIAKENLENSWDNFAMKLIEFSKSL